jgi:hypothetical protein
MRGHLLQKYTVLPTILPSHQLIRFPTRTGLEHRLFRILRTG